MRMTSSTSTHSEKSYININDGRRGFLTQTPTGLTIRWKDRAETRSEPITWNKLRADWAPEGAPARALREEEMYRIASCADLLLEALDENEPYKYWDYINGARVPHDPVLVELVVDYLRARQ